MTPSLRPARRARRAGRAFSSLRPVALPREVEAAIIGAGFGGIAAAVRLRRAGVQDVAVLERSGDVGGTWAANTYPGCQCDIPSNLYSLSFAPNAEWTHSYPGQPQIRAYLRDVARRFGVMDRTHLNCEVKDARWDENVQRWLIDTSCGSLRARWLIAATGLLSEPSIPSIPGRERFAGAQFHTARWDESHDLTGERVAVIGTGASAIQVVPRIQPKAGSLYVVQRTPPWVIPHADREIGDGLRRLYRRVPPVQRLARWGVYWLHELLGMGFGRVKPVLWAMELNARIHLRRQVPDRALRRRVTPGYRIGCKRILLSNDWYPALQQPNTELVGEHLVEVRERSLVFADGSEREVDTIVWGTGFSPTDPPIASRLRSADGRTLSDAWSSGMRAFAGTTVAGFPNLFLLYGPNTNLAHSSIVFMIEAQLEHVAAVIGAARKRGASVVEVRREAQDAWNADVQERLTGTVWDSGGCASWYIDASGDNPIMWPGQTFTFRRRVQRFQPSDYVLRDGGDAAGTRQYTAGSHTGAQEA